MESGATANLHVAAATPARDGRRPTAVTRTDVVAGLPGDYIRTQRLEPRFSFGTHQHQAAQLLWPTIGSLRAICDDRTWVLTRSTALWIPSHTCHDVAAGAAGCTIRSIYLHEPAGGDGRHWLNDVPGPLAEPTPLLLDELLLGIIDELEVTGVDDEAERVRLELVMFDRLRRCLDTRASRTDIAALPMPTDDRARRIASELLERPDDDTELAGWGTAVGASARTLRRIWREQTGLSFQQWRRAARMRYAYALVVEGHPLGEVARSVGYRNPNSFSEAFTGYHGRRPTSIRCELQDRPRSDQQLGRQSAATGLDGPGHGYAERS